MSTIPYSNQSKQQKKHWLLNWKNPLIGTGWLYVALSLLCAVLMQVDLAEITNVNRWIKPFKFAVSGFVFNWTIAYILKFYDWKSKVKSFFIHALAWNLLMELFIVFLQAGRMETSHYNFSSPLNALLFASMGILVSLLSFQVILLWWQAFTKNFKADSFNRSAIRWGLSLMIFSFVGGGMMISMSQHTIGAADGGKGLPLVNWSVEAGDLRILHFVGMHVLQALLLLAYFLKRKARQKQQPIIALTGFCLFLLMLFLGWQAINGIPLIEIL